MQSSAALTVLPLSRLFLSLQQPQQQTRSMQSSTLSRALQQQLQQALFLHTCLFLLTMGWGGAVKGERPGKAGEAAPGPQAALPGPIMPASMAALAACSCCMAAICCSCCS